MIPQSFIQDLLSRVDIVDIVESAVPLKRAGANMAACCPFHTEKSPSFTVSPAKQFYHCFGCGAHGTAIGFMMEYHGLGFVEAVKELAARVGMVVPAGEADGARQANASANVHIVDALTRASRFFKDQLRVSESAIAYLKGRGVTGEIAARFGLGYAPDGWQNLDATFPDYSTADVLVEAGLVIRSDEGRRYDRFRDRVMFPIVSTRGEIIGFGGRVLGAGEPKYLNSPETPVFEKGARALRAVPGPSRHPRGRPRHRRRGGTWTSWRWRSTVLPMPSQLWVRQRRRSTCRNCSARPTT